MVHYDPHSDQILDDPQPVYRQLRDESPAHYIEEFDTFGPTARTLRQFIQASLDLAILIRNFMIPDPDRDVGD